MEKNIKKRMVDLGITKEKHSMYFKEFNIKDMYKAGDYVCFHCSRGLACKRHNLQKTFKSMDEKKIYDVEHPKPKGQF